MSRWNFLRQIAEENNYSQTDLAKALNWQQTRFSDLFSGKSSIPAKKVYDFACFFGLDYKELKDYNDNKTDKIPARTSNVIHTDIVHIDVLDVRACCGNGAENFTENVVGQQMMTLPALREFTNSAPENIKIIKAIGESMMPTIHTDDVVWVDISVKSPTSDGLYILCIGSDLLIRRIQINPFDNTAMIRADNSQYQPIPHNNYREIKVIGKVIYHMRKTA